MNVIRNTAIALCAATRLVSSSPALADDSDVAHGIAAVAMYGQKCGELPDRIHQMIKLATASIPKDTMENTSREVMDVYRSNPIRFCEAMKSVINKGLGGKD